MKKQTWLKALVVTGVVGATVALSATPAFAIGRAPCNSAGVLKITDVTSTTCWANAGRTDVFLGGVFQIEAGNNDVRVLCSSGNIIRVNRGQRRTFSPEDVVAIRIF